MEIKDAIKSMQNIIEHWTYRPTEVEAAKLAIEALEKQIAKEAIESIDSVTTKYLCPNCGRLYWEKTYIDNYCGTCGQRLMIN